MTEFLDFIGKGFCGIIYTAIEAVDGCFQSIFTKTLILFWAKENIVTDNMLDLLGLLAGMLYF